MVEWDRLARDYVRHRQGYPEAFYRWLDGRDLLRPGDRALDLGAGTGDVARALRRHGLASIAVDPARGLLHAGCHGRVPAVRARAEALPFRDDAFRLAVCASCWHWFDGERAGRELRRILRPDGTLVLAHWIWLATPGSPGEVTNRCLLAFQEQWDQARRPGRHPEWVPRIEASGFRVAAVHEEDLEVVYDAAGWRGRIRASVPVLGRLDPDVVRAFDRRHAEALAATFGEAPLAIPHRLWALEARIRET